MAMATTRPLPHSASNRSLVGSQCVKTDSANSDSFPAGLRVLVVDDDPICLLILDRMLRRCLYQVTACGKATEALQLLRGNRDSFDLVISDVVMPDMDGFKLLELVGLELDLPVIMMSANGEVNAVMKGIKHGACDYLLKPVRMEELKNIWQHVVRRKWRVSRQDSSFENDRPRWGGDDGEFTSNDGYDWKQHRKRKDTKDEDEDGEPDNDDSSTTKKPRVVWSVDLHQQFVNAVNQLGIDKAVPKRILEMMNVQGLTRENVASHLQKYRLFLKRLSGVAHQPGGLGPAFLGSADSSFGFVGGVGSLGDPRALAGSGQLSPQALISSLQAGLLGRVSQPNNIVGFGSGNSSLLLQIAALQQQGANSTSLLRSSCGGLLVPANFQAPPPDPKQLQVSQQLGAFGGSIEEGTHGILPSQQPRCPEPLANDSSLGGINHLLRVDNSQKGNNATLMQAIQQRGGAGQLKGGGANVNLSRGRISGILDVGGMGSPNVIGNPASGTACPSSSSLPQGAASPLVASCPLPILCRSLARTAADNTTFCISSGENIDVSSPGAASILGSTRLDEGGAARLEGIGSSLGGASEVLPQNSNNCTPKFTSLSGGSLNQQSRKAQVTWQGFGLSHELCQVNSSILSPRYGQRSTASHSLNLNSGQKEGHLHSQGIALPCNFSMDGGFGKPYIANAFSRSDYTAVNSDRKLKGGFFMEAKQEPAWLSESLPADLLNFVLKQHHDGLDLSETQLPSVDNCSWTNVCEVKPSGCVAANDNAFGMLKNWRSLSEMICYHKL